jgi:hypothetical protein
VSSGKEAGWTFCGREMFMSFILRFVNCGKAHLKYTRFVFLQIYISLISALITSRVISSSEVEQGEIRFYVFRSVDGFRDASA